MTNSITIKPKAVQRKFLANIKSYLSDPKNPVLNSLSREKYGDLITTDEETLKRLAWSEFEQLKSSYLYKKLKKDIVAFSAYIQHEEIKGVRFDGRDPNPTNIKRVATAKLNKGNIFDPIKNVLHKNIFYLELNTNYNNICLGEEERNPLIITSTEVQVINGKTYPILLLTEGYSNEQVNQENLVLVDNKMYYHSQYMSTVNPAYLNGISTNVLYALNYRDNWF